MIYQKRFIAVILLLTVQQVHTMDQTAAPGAGQPAGAGQKQEQRRLTYQEVTNAGLFMPLVCDGSLITKICSYLRLRDIARLRRTCKALSSAWDHEQLIRFNQDNLPYREPGQMRLSHGLLGGKNSLTPYQRLAASMTFLGDTLIQYENPTELNLENTHLTELPKEITGLTQLRRLDLWGSAPTQEVIKNICIWLPDLEELNLGGDNLTELPKEMKNLTQLRRLGLWYNRLTQDAIKNICIWLPGLEELNLGYNNLTELPKDVRNLTHLRQLNLGYNHLTQEAIRNICIWLPGIEELNLEINNLTKLPAEIIQLTKLRRHNLRWNLLTQEAKDIIIQWLPQTKINFSYS